MKRFAQARDEELSFSVNDGHDSPLAGDPLSHLVEIDAREAMTNATLLDDLRGESQAIISNYDCRFTILFLLPLTVVSIAAP